MKFALIDRIVEFEPGERIVAVKAVSMSEEYLAEHFPTFPVLPGVFMLECMTEAARWLVHATTDFAHAVMLLQKAKGVTYKSFVAPGRLLRVEVKCKRLTDEESDFSGAGYCGADEVVKGRFSLRHLPLTSRAQPVAIDEAIIDAARRRWSILVRSSETSGAQP